MADSTYAGQVTRVTGGGVYVIVPKLGQGVEYGPCKRLVDGLSTDVAGSPYAHSHGTVSAYRPGTAVLLSTINGVPDDLVILGVLA